MGLIRRAAFALATLTLSHAALANDGLTSGACVISTGPAATGSVFAMQDLPGGGVLIGAQNGLFRLDPPSGHIISSLATTIGRVRAMHDLPGGRVLIGAQNGVFRLDPSGRVVSMGEAKTGSVLDMRSLRGGAVLILAQNGWFRFDPASERMVSIGETDGPFAMGPLFAFLALHELPGGAILIGTINGWFRYDPASGRVVSAATRWASSASCTTCQVARC